MHKFQFLIGTVLPDIRPEGFPPSSFQFLIGTVLQQCSRRFPALSSFFLLKSHKKVCQPYFLLSQISLKNQAFFKSLFFCLGRQTFFHYFMYFIAFYYLFNRLKHCFPQCFQGFRDRQTFSNKFLPDDYVLHSLLS